MRLLTDGEILLIIRSHNEARVKASKTELFLIEAQYHKTVKAVGDKLDAAWKQFAKDADIGAFSLTVRHLGLGCQRGEMPE